MKAFHCQLSTVILALCLSGILAADEAILTAYLDAAVAEANPVTNYAVGDLAVGSTAGLAWESFLQFDVGSLPANAVLTAAELRLISPVGFGSGGSLQISAPAAAWSETTVNWTSRPVVTNLADAALVVDGANTAHLSLPTPVLAHLQDIVRQASVNRGLKLSFPTATADQLLTLRSRESTSRPQLVITYELGPEIPSFLAVQPKDDGRLRTAIFKAPAGAPAPLELVWNTTPGVRYSVWESPDLGSWSRVSGYPAVADALSGLHEIQTTPPKRFFKVELIDEQPPVIVSRSPDDGAFGIKRFYPSEEIGVQLTDASGINPASISLTLGGVETFTTASPQLTYNDGLLTLDLGSDTPLGAYGALINASLAVADTLGNSATYNWSFELEREIVLVDGLFTFGSPSAQRAGQRVPPIPTRILADRAGGGGPIRMNDSEWTLESVNTGSLVIAYTGTSAPVFTIDQYLTNMTPATLSEIFYRKVTSIQDNAATKKLTLGTVDVPAWEIVTEASVSLSEDDIAFEADADGRIIRAYQMKSNSGSKSFILDPLQIDWSDKKIMGLYERSDGSIKAEFGLPINDTPKYEGEEWDCTVKLKQAILRMRPSFWISVETRRLNFGLKKLHSECTVEVDTVLEPELEFMVPSIAYDFALDNEVNNEPLIKWNIPVYLGTALWVNISPRLRAEVSITAGLTGTVSLGASGGYSQTMVIDYDKDKDPRGYIQVKDSDAYFDLITPQIALGGTAGAEIKLKPEIDVKLNSLAGFYVNLDPALGADINADFNSGTLVGADVGVTFNGHVNAGMSVLGVSSILLPSFEPWELWDKEWRWYFPESLVGQPLQIFVQPASQTVPPGDNLQLSVQANHESGVTYEWRHNGRRLFEDSPVLKLYRVTSAVAGNYQVTLRYGADEVVSAVATVTVAATPPITGEFALIPAGNFTMGQTGIAEPVHSVYVSAFYMGKYEVTKELWDTVRSWGLAHGYTDLAVGNGGYASKGANHPVHSITWYDMVKWCNARSEKENLVPCYTVSGSTYKTGSSAPDCNWNASGYRLPTGAEWEKAARGTLRGKNFPWGDTITHSQANYNSSSSYNYDVSPTRGYHPNYYVGGYPYSSPVGSFAPEPNYGLYDMAGNVSEWCWDWYASYPSTSQTDPRGPASGTYRVIRNGSWGNYAYNCHVAYSSGGGPGGGPGGVNNSLGVRLARSSVP